MVKMIGIAIDFVPRVCVPAAWDDELTLLSRTITPAT
jgi:hypothetical protein